MINQILNNILFLTDFDILFYLGLSLLLVIIIGIIYNLEN